MSNYVTTEPDGSRDVDVQSLFYDQIELVRRIARMEYYRPNVKGCTDGNCLLVKNTGLVTNGGCQCEAEIRRVPHGFDAIRTIGFLRSQIHAAQRRIAELEAERDELRNASEASLQLRDSDLRRLVDELRDAEARNAQKLSEIARLQEALSAQKIEIVHLKRVLSGICSNYEIDDPVWGGQAFIDEDSTLGECQHDWLQDGSAITGYDAPLCKECGVVDMTLAAALENGDDGAD